MEEIKILNLVGIEPTSHKLQTKDHYLVNLITTTCIYNQVQRCMTKVGDALLQSITFFFKDDELLISH